jgi:hypothetical protein
MKKVYVREVHFQGIEKNPSLLGFGCMRFPVLPGEKPEIDEKLAEKMVDYAYEHGITYYDTAYPYHHGKSETFIGKVLKKYPRNSFFLASKLPSWLIHSREDAERIFTEQLQKCQVEYFDYYLAHALSRESFPSNITPEIMDFLFELKKQGKIRHLGFSFHDSPEMLEKIIQAYSWDFVQIQCNYLDWTFLEAKKMYEIIEKKGIPCIVMEPVRGGMLSTLSEESAQIFKKADPNSSIASWAIRYVASKPNVMVVLSGMSTEEQTKDNIKTMTDFHPVTVKDQQVIQKALNAFLKNRTIPCTSCRYCMPCPHGVDIPGSFKIYNEYAISKRKNDFVEEYQEYEKQKWNACIACDICKPKCPQKIFISEKMALINTLYNSIKSEKHSEVE